MNMRLYALSDIYYHEASEVTAIRQYKNKACDCPADHKKLQGSSYTPSNQHDYLPCT